MNKPYQLGIVGAGISGLTAAWKARQLRPDIQITIFESSDRIGGVLQTDRIDGYLVENAADMFSCQPDAALQLCRELGIEDQLLGTAEPKNKAFVGLGDQVVPVPKGFSLMVPTIAQSILDWPLLSDTGKQRLLEEVNVPRRDYESDSSDESFHSFAVRRFGQEAFDVLIQPLVSGIYSADPKLLSMNATMKRFVDMEKEHGSLIKAMESKRGSNDKSDSRASGARYSLFRGPRDGFASLVSALANSFDDQTFVVTGTKVDSVHRLADRWQIRHNEQIREFDALILTTPAQHTETMLPENDEICAQLKSQLRQIKSTSCAIVVMGIQRSDLPSDFDGFGVIYPHVDGGQTIAVSFSSNKFADRAADDKLLLRFFIGGALQESLVEHDDESLQQIAITQFSKSFHCVLKPEFTRVYRWNDAMPQYHVGHLERVDRIESLASKLPDFALAGKCYRGVGIPACVESGIRAAEEILSS